jgi:hypothetical protein
MFRYKKLKIIVLALAFLLSVTDNIVASKNIGAFEVDAGSSCPAPADLIIKASRMLEYGYWITLLHADEFLLDGKQLWLDPNCYQSELIVHKSYDEADVISLENYYQLREKANFSVSFTAIRPRFDKSFDDHKAVSIVGHSGGTSGQYAHVLSLGKEIHLQSFNIGHYDYSLNFMGNLRVQDTVRVH